MVWNNCRGGGDVTSIVIRNKRLIDAFLFFNEVEMALFRMEMLNAEVDLFVVVEAKHTFSGKPKPLYFFENRHKFSKFRHKIIYRTFRGGNDANAWNNEIAQRNYFEKIFCKICFDDDLISYSDVDEIPNYKSITHKHEFDKPCVFIMDMYRYSLKYRVGTNIWSGTKMMFYNAFKQNFKTVEDLRSRFKDYCVQIKNGGWHLTYFGGAEKIATKIDSFSHTDLNLPEYNNQDNILKAIEYGNDLFRRPSIVEEVDFDETGLPHNLKNLIC